ncbi:MAG TPA: hypothetical protein VK250_09955, partial [Nitrososphaeraceae archaeon]|nr:hypothetical protein [Nitrososphaeraceae archaeon]
MTMYPDSIDDIWVNHNESFTCDNWYCRRGFNEGKIDVANKRKLCIKCYSKFMSYDLNKFEFVQDFKGPNK